MSDKVYFGIIYARYDIFNPDIKMDEVLKKTKKGPLGLERKKQVFNTKELFVTAALKRTQRGTKVNFEISKESFINTSDKKIEKIEIDFGDDLGYRKINVGDNLDIKYNVPGTKEYYQVDF